MSKKKAPDDTEIYGSYIDDGDILSLSTNIHDANLQTRGGRIEGCIVHSGSDEDWYVRRESIDKEDPRIELPESAVVLDVLLLDGRGWTAFAALPQSAFSAAEDQSMVDILPLVPHYKGETSLDEDTRILPLNDQ